MKLVNEHQKENILRTRCHISNKMSSMIIDSGSCVNVTSTILVKKLNLTLLNMIDLISFDGYVIYVWRRGDHPPELGFSWFGCKEQRILILYQ
jgi:hypothetical protein